MKKIGRSMFLRKTAAAGLAASGAGGVVAVARAASKQGLNEPPPFAGVIDGHGAAGSLRVRPPGTAPGTPGWTLAPAPGAKIWRLGGPAGTDDFQVGEEIVAWGEWKDAATFAATGLETLLYPVRGTVARHAGAKVETSGGTFDVSRARPYVDAESVDPGRDFSAARPGADVDALVLRNVDSGRLTAFEVEVLARGTK